MKIELKKFGTLLVSRPAGKEAYAAFLPTLKTVRPDDTLEIDFAGVTTFSPSWGDEFLTPLFAQYENRIRLLNAEKNPSVRLTLELLEQIRTGGIFEDAKG